MDPFPIWGREGEKSISYVLGTKYSRTLEDETPPRDPIGLVSVCGQDGTPTNERILFLICTYIEQWRRGRICLLLHTNYSIKNFFLFPPDPLSS